MIIASCEYLVNYKVLKLVKYVVAHRCRTELVWLLWCHINEDRFPFEPGSSQGHLSSSGHLREFFLATIRLAY